MKYIVFANKTKRVVLPPSDKPYTDLSKYVTQCEVDELPAKYDFLTVDNVKERTTETYYTCDLIANFRTDEELQKVKLVKYERLVEQYIRQKYSLSNELAILRQAATKQEEFNTYNEYAEQCKAKAKAEIYGQD